jgi:hypothetical protein
MNWEKLYYTAPNLAAKKGERGSMQDEPNDQPSETIDLCMVFLPKEGI